MRVLFVNLLRIGDIVAMAPVISGFKAKHPEAELDLLINEQFDFAASLLPGIDYVHKFPRKSLQRDLVEASAPLLRPFDSLKSAIHKVNSRKYDLVVNLTHNRLSGWVCSLIKAKDHEGLCFTESGQPHFGSPWFRYLDEHASKGGITSFHITDVFINALKLNPKDCKFELNYPRASLQPQKVSIQPLSSDTKKNWGLLNFKKLIENLAKEQLGLQFEVLAAPNEKTQLQPFVDELKKSGVSVHLNVCDLSEAATAIDSSELLITMDTSIKHIGCGTKATVVELAIGSADFSKTGPYKASSWILAPKTNCYPCAHSDSCSQNTHLCAADLEVEAVHSAVVSLLSGQTPEPVGGVQIHRTEFCQFGTFVYKNFEPTIGSTIEKTVERGSWFMYLNNLHKEKVGQYGSLTHALLRHSGLADLESKGKRSALEKLLEKTELEVQSWLEEVHSDRPSGLSQNLVEIGPLRQKQNLLGSKIERGKIKLKLLSNLNNHIMERI